MVSNTSPTEIGLLKYSPCAALVDILDSVRSINSSVFFSGQVERPFLSRMFTMSQWSLGKAKELFGDIKVLSRENAPEDEFAFVTPEDKEGTLRAKLGEMENINVLSTIRVVNY